MFCADLYKRTNQAKCGIGYMMNESPPRQDSPFSLFVGPLKPTCQEATQGPFNCLFGQLHQVNVKMLLAFLACVGVFSTLGSPPKLFRFLARLNIKHDQNILVWSTPVGQAANLPASNRKVSIGCLKGPEACVK